MLTPLKTGHILPNVFQCWANTWATFDRIWCFPQAALASAEELRRDQYEAWTGASGDSGAALSMAVKSASAVRSRVPSCTFAQERALRKG